MKFEGKNNEFIEIVELTESNSDLLNESKSSELSLVWFKGDNNQLKIDTVDYSFRTNDILSLTEFHHVKVKKLSKAILVRWNRDFYCIVDHDSEVSCKGILYFGASNVPIIHPSNKDLHVLETTFEMFQIEMTSADNLQLEMLQMMLKRFIILCTRIYKTENYSEAFQTKNQVIRDYNFLVEQHFREKHSVAEYAELLNKSPKTLSNQFKKLGETSPLQFIHNRILLEAKRLLTYSEKGISEIGYEIGFSDIQVFSRFFKKQQGNSPQNFREREKLTTP